MIPDNNVYGAIMGPTWVLLAPDGPHIGPMNFAIWDSTGETAMDDLEITWIQSFWYNHSIHEQNKPSRLTYWI